MINISTRSIPPRMSPTLRSHPLDVSLAFLKIQVSYYVPSVGVGVGVPGQVSIDHCREKRFSTPYCGAVRYKANNPYIDITMNHTVYFK
jgi:hypothetical protein